MEKRSALSISEEERLEREAPAVIRMAELTKRANVKREMPSSMMEYLRQLLMARRDGRYFSTLVVDSSEEVAGWVSGFEAEVVLGRWLSSKFLRRDCTIPLPR